MSYKLTYFDAPAVGESIRLLFTYGNIPFEDDRIKDQSLWPAMKPTTPFGALPILEKDGKVVNQSVAIARFVGKLVKLAGNDDWEDVQIDAVADTVNDARLKLFPVMAEKDETKKAALKEVLLKETLPFYFDRLNKGATEEGLVLDRLTWADFVFVGIADFLQVMLDPAIIAAYPNLVAVQNKVTSIPSVKAFIAKHPRVKFLNI